MRAMRLFLGFSAATAFVGAIAAGCGSSSSPSNPVDSGAGDVTMEATPPVEAAAETGPDVVETGPSVCVPDATLATIPIPDAALNDSGATAAGCVACLNQACPMLVAQCNQNCACIAAFEAFANCIASGTSNFQICAVSDLANIGSTGVDASVTCAIGCVTACGQMLPSGDGGDGGNPEASGGEGGGEAGGD